MTSATDATSDTPGGEGSDVVAVSAGTLLESGAGGASSATWGVAALGATPAIPAVFSTGAVAAGSWAAAAAIGGAEASCAWMAEDSP